MAERQAFKDDEEEPLRNQCQPENVDTDEGSNNELSEGGDDTNAGLGHGSCVDGSEKSSDDEADVGDVGARLSEHPSGGRLRCSREYLLSFRFLKECTKPPPKEILYADSTLELIRRGGDPMAYRDFITRQLLLNAIKRGAVDVTITKCVTLGPPEAGKTQLKRALLGDFTEANESTPVSTQAIPAVDIYASGKGKWVQLDMGQLKGAIQATASGICQQGKKKRTKKTKKSKAVVMTHQEKHLHKTPSVSTPSDVEDQTNKSNSKNRAKPKRKIIDMKKHEKSLSNKFFILKNEVESAFVNVEPPSASMNLHRAHLLYMVDNGGQPSFLDFHSAIATFPAIHFLVYNMKEGLDAKPKMTYRKKALPTKKLASGTLSNFDVIHRLLLTIHHLGPRFSKLQARMKELMKDQFRVFRSNPPVFIVGTHIRKKQSFQKDRNRLSSLLQSIPSLERIWETHFVNSLDPLSPSIKGLQQSLCSNSTSCSFHLPLSWFHLQLVRLALDAEEIPDLSLHIQAFVDLRNRCLEENLVASHEEFEAMIRVFHSLGVFSCPDLELSDQVESLLCFYSIVTKILDIPLRDVSVSNKPLLDLQATGPGEISSEGLSALRVPDTLGSCQGFHKRLLKWLVHWGLAHSFHFAPKI